MTPRQFWKKYRKDQPERIQEVCDAAGANREHFKNIALHKGAVGRFKAKALSEASGGEMSILEILYQDDYETESAA